MKKNILTMRNGIKSSLLGLFRKKESEELEKYSVIKLYIVLDERSWKLYVEKALDVYESLLNGSPGQYWMNYSKTMPFNKEKLLKKIFSRKFGDLENLVLTNADDSICVAMNIISSVSPNMCEVRLTLPFNTDLKRLLCDLSADLIKIGTVLYGYARSLTKDYEAASESKIKKTFGGVSITAEPFKKSWFRAPALLEDMMKGVYQLNLVRKSLLKEDYFGHNATIIDVGQELIIVECCSVDLQKIQDAGHDVSRFVQLP